MGKVEQVRECIRDPFSIYPRLTEEEREVLRLASRGYTNKYIGHRLDLTDEMVAYTLRNGLLKIGMKKKDLPNLVFVLIAEIVG